MGLEAPVSWKTYRQFLGIQTLSHEATLITGPFLVAPG